MVGLVGISIIVGLLYALVRYPAETAVMRMVDEHEQTGTKKKFKEGWRLGWNKRALRVWLIDLIIGAPAFVVIAGILTAGVFFTINVVGTETFEKQLPGRIGLIVLIFFLFLLIALLTAFLNLLRHFFVRAAALEGVTLGEAFKQGWQMFKVNLGKSLLMWLVMLGIGIGFGFVMIFAAILLVPAYAVMALPGAVVGVIPGLIGFGITSAFSSGVLPWIVGGISALPFFFTVMFAPLTFVLGMYVLFQSSVWTLTYRQFKAMATPPPALEEEIEPALPA